MIDRHEISVNTNGRTTSYQVEARRLLSDFLRDEVGLTGTHVGCEHGICGACTIMVDGRATRSCLMFAVQVNGAHIETVEGLSKSGKIARLQELFSEMHGLQCGFCTPGMLIVAYDLLRHRRSPSPADIREGMSAALCRCTGYDGIVKAVTQAAREGAIVPPPGVAEQPAPGGDRS